MWHDMFVIQIPIVEKVLRTVLVYATILVLLRITGKRDLATLNMFDFTVLFLLSNVVQNAIIGNDTSLVGGVIGAVTLVAVNAALNRWVTVSDHVARLLQGNATTIIEDGHTVPRALRRLSLRPAELDQAIRVQNGDDISEIATGQMAPGGHLVLSLKPEEQNATKGDIATLGRRLEAIEAALASLAPQASSGDR
jgi:uncharacterized membrane protein YcaP (DUF421 family)